MVISLKFNWSVQSCWLRHGWRNFGFYCREGVCDHPRTQSGISWLGKLSLSWYGCKERKRCYNRQKTFYRLKKYQVTGRWKNIFTFLAFGVKCGATLIIRKVITNRTFSRFASTAWFRWKQRFVDKADEQFSCKGNQRFHFLMEQLDFKIL